MCEHMCVHLFTQVEVDGPDWPAGLLVLVVLKDIRLTAQPAASQHKPTLFPCLEMARGKDKNRFVEGGGGREQWLSG